MIKIIVLSIIIQIGVKNVVLSQPKIEINCISDFIEIDNLNNIYVINKTDLIKYNSAGEILYRFSNQINGLITSVDVTNPLRIVVFCRESNTLTFLNQQLAPISGFIDIYSTMDIEAENAGASTAGGFWVYSIDNQNIMLFNSQLQRVQESQNLSYWIKGDSIKLIREQNQKLYLVLPQRVVVLDLFGSYLTTIHLTNAINIKISGDKLSYIKDDRLFVYNISLKNEVEKTVPITTNANAIFYNKNKTYIVTTNKINIY